MTTLVYRDGVLAADSQAGIAGWTLPTDEVKIVRLADGRLFGFTGNWAMSALLREWLEQGESGEQPDLGEDSRVVVIHKNGKRRVYEGKGYYDEGRGFGAWGSGMPPALGALHVGASAVDAVKAAIKVDPHSGGKVRRLSLKER